MYVFFYCILLFKMGRFRNETYITNGNGFVPQKMERNEQRNNKTQYLVGKYKKKMKKIGLIDPFEIGKQIKGKKCG